MHHENSDAVVSGALKLTYGQLDSASGSLASTLMSLGVGRGDRVGICVPKSLASVVSMFGILKSGAAYVPLDPSSPSQRLSYIIRDSGMKVLVTNSAKAPALVGPPIETPPGGVVLVDVDDPSAEASSRVQAPGVRLVRWSSVLTARASGDFATGAEDDMAYVLYTSGSTGEPKGVMLSHRNCLAFVNWAGDCVGLSGQDRVSSHAPIHFDLSTFDIFSSVRAGATIVLVPDGTSAFPVELTKLIEKERITVWYSVPSVLTLLALYGNIAGHDLSSLKTVIFAGEVFPTKHLRKLMSALPGRRYLNWYGPTETNVCTWYEVPLLDKDRVVPVPIGRPCSNTEVFAVDDDGNRVTERGKEGELWVRGPSVMLGYWGDRQKTERVLVPNPFNDGRTEPVYRTGDIVTVDENGDYVYRGRRDGMVKTRGYRVELGEVEAAIYGFPGVKEAAVFPIPDDIVGNLIRAVVVPLDGATFQAEEVLKYCAQRLPRYMLPDKVDLRSALPKTSTGKTDRVSLAKEAAH